MFIIIKCDHNCENNQVSNKSHENHICIENYWTINYTHENTFVIKISLEWIQKEDLVFQRYFLIRILLESYSIIVNNCLFVTGDNNKVRLYISIWKRIFSQGLDLLHNTTSPICKWPDKAIHYNPIFSYVFMQ